MHKSVRYPTKQEVIDRMSTLNIDTYVAPLQNWKEKRYTKKWRDSSLQEKMTYLEEISYILYYQQANANKLPALYIRPSNRYGLHVKSNTILLDEDRASILSTLHEIGHAIHGEAEVDACAFSVKLFARVFPTEYSKLQWHGHMLKLPA